MFRAPARVTFGRCPKSDQKDSLNLRFKNPRTLFRLQICGLLPRVHRTWLFSLCMTNRPSSCTAAAHVINGRSNSVVRRWHQRQRRRGVKKTCRWHVFSLRSRRLCRRSIHLVLHRTILNSLPQSPAVTAPSQRGPRTGALLAAACKSTSHRGAKSPRATARVAPTKGTRIPTPVTSVTGSE